MLISSRRATDAPWGSLSLNDFHKKLENEQLKNRSSQFSGSELHSTQDGSTCRQKCISLTLVLS